MRSGKQGITLISLIITIIILLILVGVSISLVVGENGVVTNTMKSVQETNKAITKEEIEMAYGAVIAEYYEKTSENANLNKKQYIDTNLITELSKTGTVTGYDENDGEIKFIYDSNEERGTDYAVTITKDGLVSVIEKKTVVVTFDANGGNCELESKEVTYNHKYGELPVPTRSGCTFKGWNGKNLVNIANHNVTITNFYYQNETSNPKYILKTNTTYTLSFNYKINSASKYICCCWGYGNSTYFKDFVNTYSGYSGVGRKFVTYTTPSSFSEADGCVPANVWFRFVRMGEVGSANVDISNIQFEESPTATAYEPYYITSDTTVVQEENHTLKAIWQANP